MTSRLDILKGRPIRNVIRHSDYLQLFLEQGVTLNIYNACSFVGFEEDDLDSLIGTVIQKILEEYELIVLCFNTGREIHIDLRNEAYNGPEAMQLDVPGEPTVVWN